MNPELEKLHTYPFQKLEKLLGKIETDTEKKIISLAIGEPKHSTPEFILDIFKSNLDGVSVYPTTLGTNELRVAIANWLCNRFNLPKITIDEDKNILPVNGTREALFSIAQTVIDKNYDNPIAILPNPFYQIYEGAVLLAGAKPYYLNCTEENGFIPDLSLIKKEVWQRCQLFYLCSPGNPSGAIINFDFVKKLLELSDEYDFVVASDECYSEIYRDEAKPPIGLLEYANKLGNSEYKGCLVFHSLSKRSNLPGLRSGFVAGDKNLIKKFYHYRTYHGCAMPLHVQKTSIAAWNDEKHVKENRNLYREKFTKVCDELTTILKVSIPLGGFYLWPRIPHSDIDFARELYTRENVKVLPGSYLSRDFHGINPGYGRIRIALVSDITECIEATIRIKRFIKDAY